MPNRRTVIRLAVRLGALGYGHVIATQSNQLGTILPNPKRIRGFSDGELVVDSADVLGVWDNRHYPSWYFPLEDVLVDLQPSGETRDVAGIGVVEVHDVLLGNRRLIGPAVVPDISCDPAVQGRVRFDFDAAGHSSFKDRVRSLIE